MRPQNFKYKLIGLTLLSILCIPYASMYAENGATKRLILLQKTGKGMKPLRPKAPDRQVITCTYDGETLHLSLVIPEGDAILSITDEALLTSTYEIDTIPLEVSVPIGQLTGYISIEMETETGYIFTGVME